ncbi:MAG: DNA polymerase III subunit delta' [Gammaproteobacteria bacterium]|jgi:DNA polymerase III subunit delta'|nr:DNA polymerase III subunit delta' [Gammaproteobacteria bacterium]MBU0771548.1 DNA polymerase III subunit delta' [Gammaproteobacteria bacterium]MBU0856023.1 DNA polymerase III subunit delta' [Gammaproteobacteria bacterium]MBU1846642.1 DNA polymerase III subunit delta' [Gammaproteobacteria bacterium]
MIYEWCQPQWNRILATPDAMPHAVLLAGPSGLGKREFAQALAARLLCERAAGAESACGHCAACRLIETGNHPDLLVVRPEALDGDGDDAGDDAPADDGEGGKAKSRLIRIAQVRAVIERLGVGSHQGGYRVVLLYPAEAMQSESANSILKVLEEPPPGTLFLLISDHPRNLLPTIRSRARLLPFTQPSIEQSLAWLSAQGVADAGDALALCAGSPLHARDLAGARDAQIQGQFVDDVSTQALIAPLDVAARWAGWLQGRKKGEAGLTDLPTLVTWLQRWMADLALQAQAGSPRVFVGRQAALQALAERSDVATVMRGYNELLKMKALAHHPLNARLFIEDMLMRYARLFRPAR